MNTTRVREKIVNTVELNSYLKYDQTGEPINDGDNILVYAKRFDGSHGTEWKIRSVHNSSESFTFEEEPEYNQATVSGTIHVDDGNIGDDYTLENPTIEEKSPIDKPKDEIKHKIIQLWQLGWQNKYLYGDTVVDVTESGWTDKTLVPPTKDDFKITTIRANSKAMHLGNGGFHTDYKFKLGVKWWSWHNMTASQRFKTLTHEMVHCYHHHHQEPFFIEHANVVARIANNQNLRERANTLFEDDINWNIVKAKTMKGVHQQPKEINTNGHKCRRDACNAVVEKQEEMLDYSYEIGTALHLHPPIDQFTPLWMYNHDFKENPNPDTLKPDNIETVNIDKFTLSTEYTDEELYEYLKSLQRQKDNRIAKFVYKTDDLPTIETKDTQTKTDNKLVALYKTMYNPKQMPQDKHEYIHVQIEL